MKYILSSLLIFCAISFQAKSQSSNDTGFAAQKLHIDSLASQTDSNKMLTNNLFLGSLMWGRFNANVFYMVGTQAINKVEYFFTEGNAGKKIFYYNKNSELIKIIDNGQEYYYARSLFDKNGKPVKDYMAKDLIFFSQESHRLMITMIQ